MQSDHYGQCASLGLLIEWSMGLSWTTNYTVAIDKTKKQDVISSQREGLQLGYMTALVMVAGHSYEHR